MNNITKGDLVRKDAGLGFSIFGNVIKVFERQNEVLIKWSNDPAIKHQFSVEKIEDITLLYSGSQGASLTTDTHKN